MLWPHLEQRPVGVLLWHLEWEALHHGLLNLANNLQALTLLEGHSLLVLGVNQCLELSQSNTQLVKCSNAISLVGEVAADTKRTGSSTQKRRVNSRK